MDVCHCRDKIKGKTVLLFSGMGREVEHLIHENTQLLETKLVWILQLAVFCNVNKNTKRLSEFVKSCHLILLSTQGSSKIRHLVAVVQLHNFLCNILETVLALL